MSVPDAIEAKGTYQQAIQLSAPALGFNILPPGQSGFIARDGRRDEHFADQWSLYQALLYKPWNFDAAGGIADEPTGGTDGADGGQVAEPDVMSLSVTPRPATRGLEIKLAVSQEMPVEVAVYDASGKRVRRLYAGRVTAGARSFTWDARDEGGHASSPGIYFARIDTPRGTRTGKIVLAP
jgi:hypothetical protein